MLTASESLQKIVSLFLDRPLADAECGVIRQVVARFSSTRDDVLRWLPTLLDDIVSQRISNSLILLPQSEWGFSAMLEELETEFGSMNVDCCGESMAWKITPLDIELVVIRETGEENHLACIRPLESDVNGWLLEEYRKRRAS